MDERVILSNEISKLILKNETDTKSIIREVNRFDSSLEVTIRNFYEIKQDRGAPLLELCEYLKYGADNYGLEEQEFKDIVDSLLQDIEDMFDYILYING